MVKTWPSGLTVIMARQIVPLRGSMMLPPSYFNPLRFMSLMRQAEQGRVLAVIGAVDAGRIGSVAGPWKQLGDRALIDAVALDEQEPSHRFPVVIDLLPKPGCRRLGGLEGRRSHREGRETRHDQDQR
jgi:hypothetical protein